MDVSEWAGKIVEVTFFDICTQETSEKDYPAPMEGILNGRIVEIKNGWVVLEHLTLGEKRMFTRVPEICITGISEL